MIADLKRLLIQRGFTPFFTRRVGDQSDIVQLLRQVLPIGLSSGQSFEIELCRPLYGGLWLRQIAAALITFDGNLVVDDKLNDSGKRELEGFLPIPGRPNLFALDLSNLSNLAKNLTSFILAQIPDHGNSWTGYLRLKWAHMAICLDAPSDHVPTQQ